MSVTLPPAPALGGGPDLTSLRASFQLHLRAENRSPKTIETYTAAPDLLIAFLEHNGMPLDIAGGAPQAPGSLPRQPSGGGAVASYR